MSKYAWLTLVTRVKYMHVQLGMYTIVMKAANAQTQLLAYASLFYGSKPTRCQRARDGMTCIISIPRKGIFVIHIFTHRRATWGQFNKIERSAKCEVVEFQCARRQAEFHVLLRRRSIHSRCTVRRRR